MFKALDERLEESLLSRSFKLFQAQEEIITGSVSDVLFGVGEPEEVHFFSSRATLAMASPVFHAMFFGPQWHREVARSGLGRFLPSGWLPLEAGASGP